MPTPLPVLVGVYYARIFGDNSGLPTGNIVTWKAQTAPSSVAVDQAYAQTIADSMTANWTTTMGPIYPNDVGGWNSHVYALGSPTLPAVTGFTSGSGASTQPLAPVSAAAIIRHSVMRRGRGSQSHSAISPLTIDQVTSNGRGLDPGFITGYTTEWNNFIGQVQADFATAYPANAIDYVQLSKKGSGATYPITGSNAETLLGTERSRTPRP